MNTRLWTHLATSVSLLVGVAVCAAEDRPSVELFQQVLDKRLQQLRPTGFTVRTVLFEKVVAGTPADGRYPFQVVATIHDYGPGYPANRYYGQTCVGKMDKWPFDMRRNEFGEWSVQGRMTVSDNSCKDNPSAGVSATPLAGLSGTPVGPRAAAKAEPAPPAAPAGDNALKTGEYACYGSGSQILAGLAFKVLPGKRYTDTDGGNAGSYRVDDGSVTFSGGHLDGTVGRELNRNRKSFRIGRQALCEPF